ncbi:hypothetical protein [Streptomyces sp. NPDC002580]
MPWNGLSDAGTPVPAGAYTWRVSAAPAGGTGAEATDSGVVRVTG